VTTSVSTLHPQVSEGDEYVLSLWRRVRPQLGAALGTIGVHALEPLSARELGRLDEVLGMEVPEMRRLTSPHKSERPRVASGGGGDGAGEPGAAASAERQGRD